MKRLPHPNKVLAARDWLKAGAPAVSKEHNALKAVRTLLDLIEALPAHLEVYNHGSPSWRRAMKLPQEP